MTDNLEDVVLLRIVPEDIPRSMVFRLAGEEVILLDLSQDAAILVEAASLACVPVSGVHLLDCDSCCHWFEFMGREDPSPVVIYAQYLCPWCTKYLDASSIDC